MKKTWLTIDELALELQVSVKSIRRAYRKGQIPVERLCLFVRFDLERVKQAMQGNGQGQPPFSARQQGQRSATGGASCRRSRPAPDRGRPARLSHRPQGERNPQNFLKPLIGWSLRCQKLRSPA